VGATCKKVLGHLRPDAKAISLIKVLITDVHCACCVRVTERIRSCVSSSRRAGHVGGGWRAAADLGPHSRHACSLPPVALASPILNAHQQERLTDRRLSAHNRHTELLGVDVSVLCGGTHSRPLQDGGQCEDGGVVAPLTLTTRVARRRLASQHCQRGGKGRVQRGHDRLQGQGRRRRVEAALPQPDLPRTLSLPLCVCVCVCVLAHDELDSPRAV
jgi:hypothetical protein